MVKFFIIFIYAVSASFHKVIEKLLICENILVPNALCSLQQKKIYCIVFIFSYPALNFK